MNHNGPAAKHSTPKPHRSKYYGRISRTNWAIRCWFRSTLTPHNFQKWGWEPKILGILGTFLDKLFLQKKIDKRGRKLVDYDSQRHSFQNLQANAAKRKDDVKLTKGRENLEEAKRTYEMLNTELHDELPALYDSRILFLVTNLQTLYASEQMFHNETSKIYAELEAIVDKLATESQRGSYTLKKLNCEFKIYLNSSIFVNFP
jgi:BAR domain